MGPSKYYKHVEKDPENIRPIWKVLHSTIFLLIIFNSLLSAYIFGDLLKTFNYRCILHVEPNIALTKTIFTNNFTQEENQNLGAAKSTTLHEDTTTYQQENSTTRQSPPDEKQVLITIDEDEITRDNHTYEIIDWSQRSSISESLQHLYIYNDTFWYKNDSLYGKIDLRIRGSDYGSTTSCDLVLFAPLISLIAAAAFGALILLYGRGQQSQKSWIIVYPILIASAILTILSIIAMVSMRNGIEDFCSHLQDYTGQSQCTHYIAYFTFQGQWILSDFWENYRICYFSYILALLLWAIQLVVTILRLVSLADFQFMTIYVEQSNLNTSEDLDEKIHNALLKSGMKPVKELMINDEDNVKNESTTV